MFFDSHCHLTDARLYDEVDAVVHRARDEGVTRMVTIGAEPDDFDRVCDIAARFAGVWAAVGIHPHVADRADPGTLERLVERAGSPGVVALGEAGLDYHYDHAPRAVQRRTFSRQLALAESLGLPVVVHSREADDDTAAMIREVAGRVRGVLHCFAGGPSLLDAGLAAGWYVSFSGLVTFRNYEGGDLLRQVPADRLLIETDSPYLAPVPRRGRRNEPAFVRHVAAGVATLRGEMPEAVAEVTTRNACVFYALPLLEAHAPTHPDPA